MTTRTIYCLQGGLMEDPKWHWEKIGEANGDTLKECCDNLAKNDAEFAKYYNPNTLGYWGWELGFKEDVLKWLETNLDE